MYYPYDYQLFSGTPGGGFGPRSGFGPGGFGQGGGMPPGPPPGFGGGQGQGPTGPPPSYIPQQSPSLFAVDPGAIRGCLFRYTYVWLNNGRSFWFYPTFVGRTSVAGYRWRPRQFRWDYFGIDTQRIASFSCR
ncbi:collagen-like protein [Bacillus sp. CMF21]|uniref:collagen-like protein n=1 Tax=Metabacillus dongyingensis TaxID=2874282 RepID=UPI001CC0C09F|nr:collagen-like protein [Metabacillus dongyingensis]USK30977.1 collagen-like protein [Bacillus sp. CMF21]